jgi:hypothetical protein
MSSLHPRRRHIVALACALVVPGALGATPAVVAQTPGESSISVRSVTGFGTHFQCTAVVGSGPTSDCETAGTMDVRVSSSIKKRLKLPSTAVAKDTIRRRGEGVAAVPKGSKAMGARLKASALAARGVGKGNLNWGMEVVPVKVVFKLTGPFARTITQNGKLRLNFAQVWTGSAIDFNGGAYLCIPQSGAATFVFPQTCGMGGDSGGGGRGDGGGRG